MISSRCDRQAVLLEGFWNFKTDPERKGEVEKWYTKYSRDWDIIYVPAPWNEQRTIYDQYMGAAWYVKEIYVPTSWSMGAILIRFDGVMGFTRIWVNGKYVGEHEGSFTPFKVRIDEATNVGKNLVAVMVDNKLSLETCPQGRTMHRIYIDWFNWGGIYRNVYLESTCKAFLHSPYVIIKHKDKDWEVDVRGRVENLFHELAKGEITLILSDQEGKTVKEDSFSIACQGGSSIGYQRVTTVDNPRKWSPDNPYLYTLEAKLDTNIGIDRVEENIGFRKVEFRKDGIFLNDKPIYLTGVSMVEDFPFAGKSVPGCVIRRDYDIMKRLGVDAIRHGAYPVSKEELKIADRLGVFHFVVFPSRKVEKDDVEPNVDILERVNVVATGRQGVRDIVENLRNHPSVIAWLLASEPPFHTEGGVNILKEMYKDVKELDPTRPVAFLLNFYQLQKAESELGKDRYGEVLDQLLDYVYLWFDGPIHDEEVREVNLKWMHESLNKLMNNCKGKTLFIEYGGEDYTIAGERTEPPLLHSEDHQAEFMKWTWSYLSSRKDVAGILWWNLYDYRIGIPARATLPGLFCPGLYTRDRKPKLASSVLRELFAVAKGSNTRTP